MKKYIVKNCPAYDYDKEFNCHICKQPLVPYECSVDDCQNYPDCVIKQIVGLCKEEKEPICTIDNDDGTSTTYFKNGTYLANKILEALEIEEVNE